MQYTQGDGNVCGHAGKHGQSGFNEERIPVACKVTLSGSGTRPLTVRVWTDLDSGASDESFGIDNVIITKLGYIPCMSLLIHNHPANLFPFPQLTCPFIPPTNTFLRHLLFVCVSIILIFCFFHMMLILSFVLRSTLALAVITFQASFDDFVKGGFDNGEVSVRQGAGKGV